MYTFLTVLLSLPAVLAAATIDRRQTADTIPDSWIVTLKDDATLPKVMAQVGALSSVSTHRQYNSAAFKGFAFKGKDSNGLLDVLSKIGAIESIQPDRRVSINAPAVQIEQRAPRYARQQDAPWGLVRITRRKNVQTASNYVYDSLHQGDGVTAYVIDTGINLDHQEFDGRAVSGFNFIDTSASANDDNGHGTHVSGTIGGKTTGIAKNVTLVAVKVLGADGAGSASSVLSGIDWVVTDATTKRRNTKAVANLSLGAGYYDILNQAVSNAVKAGVFFAVAAGNSNADASNFSPASAADACTIAASDRNDTRASFSNFGSVVDLYAPGVEIYSSWVGSNDAYALASGTSMASPHVAGVAAVLRSKPAVKADAAGLCALMQKVSTKNVITDAGTGTTTNLLNLPRPNQK